MKKYMDIERLKDKYAVAFKAGEHITITEKIDGANASIVVNEDGTLTACSRRNELTPQSNLQGFYEYVQKLDAGIVSAALTTRYILFGEWLCLSGDTVIKKASSGKARNTMTLREMYQQKYTLRRDAGCKRGIKKLLNLLYKEKAEITEQNYNKIFGLDKETTIKEALNKNFIIKENGKYIITQNGIDYIMNYYFQNSTWGKDGFPSIFSLNLETDSIQINRIADIVYTGDKEVYELTTHKGYKIKATREHKFLTPYGWKPLSELKELDCVAITDFISRTTNQPNYDYEFDYIVNIEYKGIEDCYDIAMEGGEDLANFIANNFIVHNCKHTIRYPEDKMKQFYVFDVYDTETEQYMPWEFTKQIAEFIGLKTVPLFYDGPFTSWEDIYTLVGKTEMGGEPTGEGIVIKSQDRLDNKFSGTPEYVKIVAKEFSEVHQSKPQKEIDPEKLAAKQAAEDLAATIVTSRRVEKSIQKLIEDSIIPENWDEKDLGTIAKHLPRAVYNDCVKEEPETVDKIENFGKICGSLTMKLARELVK